MAGQRIGIGRVNILKSDIDQSSPQMAIEGFKSALTDKDWRRAFVYLTQETQRSLVGALLMATGYATDGDTVASPKLQKIMQRHGLRKHEKTDIAKADLLAIVRDLMKWSDKFLPEGRKLDLVENAAQTEYSEYRVTGDYAYVIATCKGRRSETRLKRIDSRWYLV